MVLRWHDDIRRNVMIDLRQMRHFVTVCEELHFRRAAERLGMTQPPLTQSVQAMERELGVALLRRDRRHVALTKAGELLLAEARAALAQADRMMMVAQRAKRGELGTLRVGFSISASFVRAFTQSVHSFQQNNPDVALELRRITGPHWLGLLEQGVLDLCVVRPTYPIALPAGLTHKVLQRDRLMLLLHARHRLHKAASLPLTAVAEEAFILHPPGDPTAVHHQVKRLWDSVRLTPRITQELVDTSSIMGLVAAGIGLSILPSMQSAIHIDDVIWRPIDAPNKLTETGVVLVYPTAHQHEMPQAAFLTLIMQHSADMEDGR